MVSLNWDPRDGRADVCNRSYCFFWQFLQEMHIGTPPFPAFPVFLLPASLLLPLAPISSADQQVPLPSVSSDCSLWWYILPVFLLHALKFVWGDEESAKKKPPLRALTGTNSVRTNTITKRHYSSVNREEPQPNTPYCQGKVYPFFWPLSFPVQPQFFFQLALCWNCSANVS